jgi:hypothetical protein
MSHFASPAKAWNAGEGISLRSSEQAVRRRRSATRV